MVNGVEVIGGVVVRAGSIGSTSSLGGGPGGSGPAEAPAEQQQQVVVYVAHLKSYKHMGQAEIRCGGGGALGRPSL